MILGFAIVLAILAAARAQQAQQRSSGSLPAAPLNARPGVEDAVAILQHGIALAPYTPSFYPLLSSCYEAMGNRQEAVVSIQNGLRLFPADTVMVEQLKKLRAGVFKPSK